MEHKDRSKGQMNFGLFRHRKQEAENSNTTSDIMSSMSDTNNDKGQLDLGMHREIDNLTPKEKVQQNEQNNNSSPLVSRRKFMAGVGLIGIASALGYLTKGKLPIPDFGGLFQAPTNPENQPKEGTMVLAQKEEVFREEMIGYLSWSPDGPISYWTTASNKRRYLFTGGQDNATYMLETDGTQSLKQIMKSGQINQNSFKEVWGPDINVEYRKYYSGITSVLQTDKNNPDHLVGVTHNENRIDRNASGSFTATIGLVESLDGGLTWTDKGPIIQGDDPQTPGKDVSGAGQPTAILNQKDGYAYIMYVDWARVNFHHKDQVYLARMKANDNGTFGQVEYWTSDNKFDTNFDPNKMNSVISVPNDKPEMIYTALPNVALYTTLNQFGCEGECDTGFWFATSPDLINWSEPQINYDFTQRGGKPHSILKPGEKWDSYPTPLDESQKNSKIIGGSGDFVHSSGDNLSPHEPAIEAFTIQ